MKKRILLILALASCSKVNQFNKKDKALPGVIVVAGAIISSLKGCDAGANLKNQTVTEDTSGNKVTNTWRAKLGFGEKAENALESSSEEELQKEKAIELEKIKKLRKKLEKQGSKKGKNEKSKSSSESN
jgi:hypothetical protein